MFTETLKYIRYIFNHKDLLVPAKFNRKHTRQGLLSIEEVLQAKKMKEIANLKSRFKKMH